MSSLFSEITIKNHKIKNRIVMPPMVCFGWSDENGHVTDKNISHYENCAKGGVGLIILEAHSVDKNGRLADSELGIWSDEHIGGLAKIASACHVHGSKVLVQINHAGCKTPNSVSETPLSPSDFNDGKIHARAMTLDEIYKIQNEFVDAAVRAKTAGLDGIELHGAHGYLIDQFMSPVINKRTDEYGGTLENRTRFACEIIDGIKNKLGDNFIIGYRMGGNEPILENGIAIAKTLENHGIDLLHVSAGISDGSFPTVPQDFPYNYIVYCGTQIKKHVHIPVIVVNDIRTPARASYLIHNKLADFTAIGRGILVDPNWANKAKNNMEIIPCLKCMKCWWFINGEKCPGLALSRKA